MIPKENLTTRLAREIERALFSLAEDPLTVTHHLQPPAAVCRTVAEVAAVALVGLLELRPGGRPRP